MPTGSRLFVRSAWFHSDLEGETVFENSDAKFLWFDAKLSFSVFEIGQKKKIPSVWGAGFT